MELPRGVLLRVMGHAAPLTMCALARTCRTLHTLAVSVFGVELVVLLCVIFNLARICKRTLLC
jgi:hypothetical protein